MRRRRGPAILLAALLALSGVVACFHPTIAAAAEECCSRRCHHDTSGERATDRALDCCRAHRAPAEAATTAQINPPAGMVVDVPAPAIALAPASAAVRSAVRPAHDPPRSTLVQQHCALLV